VIRQPIIPGLLILLLGSGIARAAPWDEAAVRIIAYHANYQALGSGVIIGANGNTGVVLTACHVIEGPCEIVVFRRDGHGYRARLIALNARADLAALLIKDTGDLPIVSISQRLTREAIMAGYGGGNRLILQRGQYLRSYDGGDTQITFRPVDGDSGAGVFALDGSLEGIVWGRGEEGGTCVGLGLIHQFLADARCARYLRPLASAQTAPVLASSVPIREELAALSARIDALEARTHPCPADSHEQTYR